MGQQKTRTDYFAPGDWNAACYVCGRKFKASELIRHWQGYYVCKDDWEPRQPQDFVRGVPDDQTVPWVQPQTDAFAAVCFPNDQSAIPGYAIPGCVKPDYINPSNTIPFDYNFYA